MPGDPVEVLLVVDGAEARLSVRRPSARIPRTAAIMSATPCQVRWRPASPVPGQLAVGPGAPVLRAAPGSASRINSAVTAVVDITSPLSVFRSRERAPSPSPSPTVEVK